MQNNANDIWTKLYPPVCKYSWQHKRGAYMALNHTHAASPTRQCIGVGPFLSINKPKAHGKQHEKRRCGSTNPCRFTLTATLLSFPSWKCREYLHDPKWCLSKLSYQKDCPSWRWLHLLKRTDAWPHLQKSTGKPSGETVAACHIHLSTQFCNQSINQSINQAINQSINQATNTFKITLLKVFANQFIHSTCYHLKNKSLHFLLTKASSTKSISVFYI